MNLRVSILGILSVLLFSTAGKSQDIGAPPPRLVILKIDGLNGGLLLKKMDQIDPATGKSRLPWFSYIFRENGTIFQNFYTRGISLSAPSWSMLDTGRHGIIRGNVEYDRFTGQVYDYLNFFPFYIGYARNHQVDMPGVEVLNRAGIPLLIDSYSYPQVLQSFQLYQRGVRWDTLTQTLARRFSGKNLFSLIENPSSLDFSAMFYQQMEHELEDGLKQSQILYLDLYTGAVDHEGHATDDPQALFAVIKSIDGLAGRIWTGIESSPYRGNTLFVVVSDHGMNVSPGVVSQGFNLPDFFNSRAGGAHHVVTNRHQLSDYKLAGLDPLVRRVTNPSDVSLYLMGKAKEYPTAWLDLDGNERAAVQLRFSDLNKIHILLLQLSNSRLSLALRKAAAICIETTIDQHRTAWMKLRSDLSQEMEVLARAIVQRQAIVAKLPKKRKQWTPEQLRLGENKAALRMAVELAAWKTEYAAYSDYLKHLSVLLAFEPDPLHAFHGKIEDLIPPLALGDNNTVADLQHYVVGPSATGLVIDANGRLDEARSFIHLDYFPLLLAQRVHNNPQAALTPYPIDFIDMRLPDGIYSTDVRTRQHAYWLYGGEESQIIIVTDPRGRIKVMPVEHLTGNPNGTVQYKTASWRAGLPLHLMEDPALHLPPGADPGSWLSAWHNEREWMNAIHLCRYSNGVIGVTEQLSPVVDNVPGTRGMDPVMLRFERRRRALVQADFHIFAADHWNFNARSFNPGGNHGSFLRISTHSVWMMAGPGVPRHHRIETPYDTLNFASTVLFLAHKTPPMSEEVVPLQSDTEQ